MAPTRVLLVGLFLVAGCGGEEPQEETLPEQEPAFQACVEAVGEAAEGSEGPDLWPAFGDCGSTEEFAAAVEESGVVLPGGVEPETYVQTRCAEAEEIDVPDLCNSL